MFQEGDLVQWSDEGDIETGMILGPLTEASLQWGYAVQRVDIDAYLGRGWWCRWADGEILLITEDDVDEGKAWHL